VTELKARKFSGPRLRAAREAAGLSRFKLAHRIDFLISPKSIIRYESGEIVPTIDVVLRIANVLKLKVRDLTDAPE